MSFPGKFPASFCSSHFAIHSSRSHQKVSRPNMRDRRKREKKKADWGKGSGSYARTGVVHGKE